MMPSIIYETLIADSELETLLGGDSMGRILELESVDERPFSENHFIIISMQEDAVPPFRGALGPTYMQIWVHIAQDKSRDYGPINKILNRIHTLLLPLADITGEDGAKLTQIDGGSRSGNLVDPGWKTTTRNALYGVLFDQLHV